MPEQNESRLLYEVMQAIGRFGAVYRTNAGSAKLPNGKTFRGLPKGFSDCMLIRPGGRVYFIETKVRPNRLTEEQTAFIEKMRRLGCGAGVAYSVDDALRICEIMEA
jgi:hypothetical protein